jgi:CHASE1-domain containing sensor protein
MTTNHPGPKPALRRYWAVAVALVIGLASTGSLTALLWRSAQQADQTRFDMQTHLVLALFNAEVEKYEQAVGRIAEFFNQEEMPSQNAWLQLMDRLKLYSHYPSLLEAGYGVLQKGSELMQPSPILRQAIPANCVFPAHLLPERTYMPLLYMKVQPPLNPYSLGFDLLENARREGTFGNTICSSWYRNSFAVTLRMSLGLGGVPTNISGFYMVRAVYDSDLPLETSPLPNEDSKSFQDRMLLSRNAV